MMLIDETFERKIALAAKEAREEGRLEIIKNLMIRLNCSAEEAMNIAGIQGEERKNLIKELNS